MWFTLTKKKSINPPPKKKKNLVAISKSNLKKISSLLRLEFKYQLSILQKSHGDCPERENSTGNCASPSHATGLPRVGSLKKGTTLYKSTVHTAEELKVYSQLSNEVIRLDNSSPQVVSTSRLTMA